MVGGSLGVRAVVTDGVPEEYSHIFVIREGCRQGHNTNGRLRRLDETLGARNDRFDDRAAFVREKVHLVNDQQLAGGSQ